MLKLYDEDAGAYNRLYALQKTYPYAVPVLGGAIYASTAAKMGDMDALVGWMAHALDTRDYKVQHWEGGIVSICENFCHVCLVDPKLVEAYMGMTFADIAALL